MDPKNKSQDENSIAPKDVVYIKEEPSDDIFLYEGDVKEETFIDRVKTEPTSSASYLSIQTGADPYLSLLPNTTVKNILPPHRKVYTIRQSQIRSTTESPPIPQSARKRISLPTKEAGNLECVKCEIYFPNIELLMKHGAEHVKHPPKRLKTRRVYEMDYTNIELQMKHSVEHNNKKYPPKQPPYESRRGYEMDYVNIDLLMKRGAEQIKQKYPGKPFTSKSRLLSLPKAWYGE